MMRWYHYVWAPSLISHLKKMINQSEYKGPIDRQIAWVIADSVRFKMLSENLSEKLRATRESLSLLPTFQKSQPLGFDAIEEAILDVRESMANFECARSAMIRQITTLGEENARLRSLLNGANCEECGGKSRKTTEPEEA